MYLAWRHITHNGCAYIIREMLAQHVQPQMTDRTGLTYQRANPLGGPIAAAASAVLATLTNCGKVIACGAGSSVMLAKLLVRHFLYQLERERPALPAVWMAPANALRQMGALASADNFLLLVAETGVNPELIATVATAHERDVPVLALTGAGGGALGRALRDTDVHVCAPHARAARINELHHVALDSVCDGIEIQLLGETPETEKQI